MAWLRRSGTSLNRTTSAIHGDEEQEPTVPTMRAYGVGGGAGNTFYLEQVAPNPQKPCTEATSCKYSIYYKAESLNNKAVFLP